jgi:hypothetical protein
VKLVDWLGEMLSEGSVASVRCQGTECDGETP